MTKKKFSKVLVADDHAVVRTGIKFLLKGVDPAVDVTPAEDFFELLELIRKEAFDVLILDINIPGGDNIGMISTIRRHRPELPILIFTSYSEKIYGLPYLQEGADGFLSKDASEEDLLEALKCIEQGKKYIGATLRENMLESLISSGVNPENPLARLSIRELDVANLLIKGYSTGEIANQLNLQRSTISTFKARIFAKMEVTNLVELIAKMKGSA